MAESKETVETKENKDDSNETKDNGPKPSDNEPPYCECNIYRLYNDMERRSTLILDVRSKSDYDTNHVLYSEHFDIPNNFKFTTSNDLLSKLSKNIEEFKIKVFEKLKTTKKNELLIHCYGDDFIKTSTEKYNVLYQLSVIFGLKKSQLKILKDPGFISFEEKFPFLCSKYIKEEELQKATEFSSILDALKTKNKIKDDGTFYGKIKSTDRKYPNSIIFDKLFLGNGEHSKDLKVLQQLNITHIVNATLKFKNEFESFGDIKYLQLAIDDKEDQQFEPFWDKIMDFMKCIDHKNEDKDDTDNKEEKKGNNNNNNNNNRVLVHCEMGMSRSATICIAYLMQKLKISLYDAYVYVLDKRPVIRPNAAFLKQLEKYEKKLFDGVSTLKKVENDIREIYLQNLTKEQQI